MAKRIGVIVARFQVHKLHEGHIHLIDSVYEKCDELIILLGEPARRSQKNPLSFGVRMAMIYETYPAPLIFKLYDNPSNQAWSENLDKIVSAIASNTEDVEVTLYGSRDSFKSCYSGKYPVEDIPELEGFSGSDSRSDVLQTSFTQMDSNFRAGIIYGYNQAISIG